jgi:hypothetical protein
LNRTIQLLQVQDQQVVDAILTEVTDQHLEDARTLIMLDVLKKRCLIESQLRRRLVYISALATAPWSRPVMTNPPTYKGVGGNLVDFAVARSHELGYQGRICPAGCARIL